MPAFNFMETFFFLSLGITFVLLLLLVYHFKQRIAKTEEKVDTLFDIIQSLAKETSDLRSHVTVLIDRQPMFSGNPMFPPFHMMDHDMDDNKENVNIQIQELDLGEENGVNHLGDIMDITDDIEDDDEEDDEEDEEEDEEEDDDEEDEDEDEDEDDDEEVDQPFVKIKIEDDDVPDNNQTNDVEDLHLEVLPDAPDRDQEALLEVARTELESEGNTSVIEERTSDEMDSYKKMNLNVLKQLVVSKGLVKDASKLKKNDILKLLS
jgi:hypothetical protein